LASQRAGRKGLFTNYRIVGDDISLVGSDIAKAYQEIMASIDVDISIPKSFIYQSGSTPAAELCKRIFIKGIELTTYPTKLIAKVAGAAHNVVRLQDILIGRGAFTDRALCVTVLLGLIDRESSIKLLQINALPSSVTGLKYPSGSLTDNLSLSSMYDGQIVTEVDLYHAYLYSAVVSQIKRLDALLKESALVAGIIMSKAEGHLVTQLAGVDKTYLSARTEALSRAFPVLKPFSPIVRAVTQEVDRVGTILSALRAGDASISAMAKGQIIDQFRTPIMDILSVDNLGSENPPAFSLVNKALTALDSVVLDREGGNLNFSLLLTQLQRHYSVDWIFKEGVFVNTVKSKVEFNIALLSDTMATLSGAMALSPRANRKLQDTIREQRKEQSKRESK